MQKDQENNINNRKPITFNQFKNYCSKIVPILNSPQITQTQNTTTSSHKKHIISYTASYKHINMKFAKQHDCQYLQIQQLSQQLSSINTNTNTKYSINKKILLKINIIYSLSYQIPLLLFMPYHLKTVNDDHLKKQAEMINEMQKQNEIRDVEMIMKPFTNDEIYSVINPLIGSQKMNPNQDNTGVFIMQNPINKQYFYTLHHCYMDTNQMNINQIIPYYLAIIGCHPQILLN